MAEIGISNAYYAVVEEDSPTALVYATPKRLPGLMSVNINPNIVEATLYADNGPQETHTSISRIDVEIGLSDISLEDQAVLLGNTFKNGGIKKKAGDTGPYVAFGFIAQKSNGKNRFVWLKKGKFSESQSTHQTQGEQLQFNTPVIRGSFVATIYDQEWQAKVDEDSKDYDPEIGEKWFTDTTLEEGLAATAAPSTSSTSGA